jgi:hypothetical protein
MMKRVVLAAVGAMSLLAGSFASAEPVTPGKAAQTERADNPSRMDPAKSRRMALARRYMEAMHYQQTVASTLKSLMPVLLGDASSRYGGLSEHQRQALMDACLETMDRLTPQMMDNAVAAMSDVLSEDELTQLVAFYESPVGQSIVAKNGQISTAMAGPLRDMLPQMKTQMIERFCAKINCAALPKPPAHQAS